MVSGHVDDALAMVSEHVNDALAMTHRCNNNVYSSKMY